MVKSLPTLTTLGRGNILRRDPAPEESPPTRVDARERGTLWRKGRSLLDQNYRL